MSTVVRITITRPNFFVITLNLAVLLVSLPAPNALKVEYAASQLPRSLTYSRPFYDGLSSIYLFGGLHNNSGTTAVLRYDVDTDSIEKVSEMPSASFRGSVQQIDEYIYYFGGYLPAFGSRDIIKFDPVTDTGTHIGNLPMDSAYHTSFKSANSTIAYFLFNVVGTGDSRIYAWDTVTYEFSHVSNITGFQGFTSVTMNNYAYIFGYETELALQNQVLRIDMVSFDLEIVSPDSPMFSAYSYLPELVGAGQKAYMIGGYYPESGIGSDFLLEFNLENNSWAYLEVDNFPVKTELHYYNPPSGIYVEKSKRLYFFGGTTLNETTGRHFYHDQIWYIDLSLEHS